MNPTTLFLPFFRVAYAMLLFVCACLSASFFSGQTARADFTPELRVYTVTDDLIIRWNDPNWDYTGLLAANANGPAFTIGDAAFQAWSLGGASSTLTSSNTVAMTATYRTDNAGGIHSNNISLGKTLTNPGGGTAEINKVFANSNHLGNNPAEAVSWLTLTGLEADKYYTVQLFAQTAGQQIDVTYAFDSNGSGTTDPFVYYPSAGAVASAPVNSLRMSLNNGSPANPVSSFFPGVTNPMAFEYSFQADASGEVTIDFTNHSNNASWRLHGFAIAERLDLGAPAANFVANHGKMEILNEKIFMSAFSEWDNGMLSGANWKIETATTLDGLRTEVASGTQQMGNDTLTVKVGLNSNAFDRLGLDPGFEIAGTDPANSPWTIVGAYNGSGDPAFVGALDAARPKNGDFFAYPGQAVSRDNGQTATGVIRSGEFELTGEAISWNAWGGSGNTAVTPTAPGDFTSDMKGFMGVAVLDVTPGSPTEGEYVLTEFRPGGNEGTWKDLMFTAEEITDLMTAGVTNVQIDLIDDFNGGWGWSALEDFFMADQLRYDDSLYYFLSIDGQEMAFLAPGATSGEGSVPEPATWVLMLLGLAGLAWRQRQSRTV